MLEIERADSRKIFSIFIFVNLTFYAKLIKNNTLLLINSISSDFESNVY